VQLKGPVTKHNLFIHFDRTPTKLFPTLETYWRVPPFSQIHQRSLVTIRLPRPAYRAPKL